MDRFKISTKLPVNCETFFNAWLNSEKHSLFTGGKAKIVNTVGGKFSTWDGYITGTTIAIVPNKKIIQKWRTIEFPDDCSDSVLEILIEELAENRSKITLNHHHIPRGQGNNYKKGWREHYFEPMLEFFTLE